VQINKYSVQISNQCKVNSKINSKNTVQYLSSHSCKSNSSIKELFSFTIQQVISQLSHQ